MLLHRHGKSLVAKLYQNSSSPPSLGEVEEEKFRWSLLPLPHWNEGTEVVIEPYE
jgi:hypothetical protein